jgi:excisionase family DNA binding protein
MKNPDKLNFSSARSDSPLNTRVMTVTEIAEYLRIHRSTVYRLLKRQAIPGFRVGSDWRFNVEEIDAWRLTSTAQVDDSVVRPSKD